MKNGTDRYDRIKKRKWSLSIAGLLLLLWWVLPPDRLFEDPVSTVVTSRDGHLLGARIAADGQWRFPSADTIPHRMKTAIIQYEDRHFYHHPGINPVSVMRALHTNLTTDRKIGGSTITQQVVRLSRKNPGRTYFEKLKESLTALRIEFRYSKEDILRMYISHAPFGGNVVGLPAATWRYYGLPADELSWGQAAALAILPNAPSLIYPGKNEVVLKKKRDALLGKLYERGYIDSTTLELALEEPLPGEPVPLPDVAPHFTEKIRKEHPETHFVSTIDYHLQKKVNSVVRNHYKILAQNKIYNIAVLVMDVKSRQVLAYVGNSPTTPEHNRYVDIIDKPRSTGSVLKPFLYAAMLDAGELLPGMLVSDIPTNINGYNPQNFDKKFRGAVPAREALTLSLNIPAVRMLSRYGLDRFYNKLKKLDLTHLSRPADTYGLSLILGGAEGSLWDVTKAYAGLASVLQHYQPIRQEYYSDEFITPVFQIGDEPFFGEKQAGPAVFGAGSVYETLNTLKDLNRPVDDTHWKFFENARPIAWKTGTSFGFKDAWAVGVTPEYAIGVWVGNASGEGRPGLVGIEAAAPVLFDVLAELPGTSWFSPPYSDMISAEICTQSGHLAGPYCGRTTEEWIPRRGTRSVRCPYHERIFTDRNEKYRVNSSCYPLEEMKAKNWFSLPPVQEFFYTKVHPEYKPLPPYLNHCLRDGEKRMAFIYPAPDQTVILPRNFDEEVNEVIFKLAYRGETRAVYWYLDGRFLGKTDTFHEIAVKPEPGKYILMAVDQEGNEIRERITVAEG